MDLTALEPLSKIAVTLFGFSGTTAVFGRVTKNHDFIAIRTKGLLITAGLAFAASTIPLSGVDLKLFAGALAPMVIISSVWCIVSYILKKEKEANLPLLLLIHGAHFAVTGWLIYSLYTASSYFVNAYLGTICVLLMTAAILYMRLVVSIEKSTAGQ